MKGHGSASQPMGNSGVKMGWARGSENIVRRNVCEKERRQEKYIFGCEV
jgi:hypothetical protein